MLRSGRLGLVLLLLVATEATAGRRLIPIAASAVVTPQSSNPGGLTRIGSHVLFAASDAAHGRELWTTDGTAAGTSVFDLVPGIQGSVPVIAGVLGEAALIMTDENGDDYARRGFWRSDGTAAGTWKIGAIVPKLGTSIETRVVIAGDVAFVITGISSSSPSEFWITDGTRDSLHRFGAYPVDTYQSNPIGAGGKLYFTGRDPVLGWQVWVSDGTAAGTHVVNQGVQSVAGSAAGSEFPPLPLFSVRGAALFRKNDGIYRTDGTAEGTTRLVAVDGPYYPLVSANGQFAWVLGGNEMLRVDGTTGGTRRIPRGNATPLLALDDGRLFFSRSIGGARIEFLMSDGTAEGTKLHDPMQFEGSGRPFGMIGSRIFVAIYTKELGEEVWVTDANLGGTHFVKDLDPRRDANQAMSSHPFGGVALGDKLLFSATSSAGNELWVSDGTPDGTSMLANIAADVPSGAISGTVRDAVSGAPLGGASVTLCAAKCEDTVSTSAAGQYRFDGVLPGPYSVRADHPTSYVQRVDGAGVAAGFETAGVDFAMPRGGTISGRVTRAASGAPVGAQVTVRSATGVPDLQVVAAGADGRYRTRGLAPGSYFVEAHALTGDPPAVDQVYAGRNCGQGCGAAGGDAVVVTGGGDLAGIDFALHAYGTFSGTLRDAVTHLPAGGMTVRIAVPRAQVLGSVTTDARGRYQSPLLPEGSYQASVDAGRGYEAAVYRGGVSLPVDGAVTGVDFELKAANARLTGVITDLHGTPVPQLALSLLSPSGNGIDFATTGDDGRYEFFRSSLKGPVYLKAGIELYRGIDCPTSKCNVAGATPIELADKQTTIVDFRVRLLRTTIRGRVTNAITGAPLPNVTMLAFALDGRQITYVSTQADGTYSITVNSREAAFYLTASQFGTRRIAYPNARTTCPGDGTCTFPPEATPLEAGKPASEINFALAPNGIVRGTVFDADTGLPVPFLTVNFASDFGDREEVKTDAAGRYSGSIGAGPARVFINASGLYPYGEASVRVDVPADDEVSGVDLRVRPLAPGAGKIRGRVVDGVTGAPIPNARVDAVAKVCCDGGYARTDANGEYELPSGPYVLSDADYRVFASAEAPYLRSSETVVFVGRRSPAATTAGFRLFKLRLTSVSPAAGPASGGATITITGENIPQGVLVSVGNKDAKIVRVTPEEIVAVTPAGTPGAAHVTIAPPATSWTIVLVHAYLYQ